MRAHLATELWNAARNGPARAPFGLSQKPERAEPMTTPVAIGGIRPPVIERFSALRDASSQLSQEGVTALGGESAFNSLRAILRNGFTAACFVRGSAGAAAAAISSLKGVPADDPRVEIHNHGGSKVSARQVSQPQADGSELKRIIIDIVGEILDGGQLGAIGKSR